MIRREAGESGNSSEDENFPGIVSTIMFLSLQELTLKSFLQSWYELCNRSSIITLSDLIFYYS